MKTEIFYRPLFILIFTLISISGLFLHNSDLPNLTLLSPENSIPSLISILLLSCLLFFPNRKIVVNIFLGWALLNLVGGLLSAIPFSFWSLGRLQTSGHYTKHSIYAIAQIPLIILLIKYRKNKSFK